jgi:superfamily II DNA/RNA helicase
MINPNQFVDNLQKRYQNFILTSICQNNNKLKNELVKFFEDKKIFDTDSFREGLIQYEFESIDNLDCSWMDPRLKQLIQSEKINNKNNFLMTPWKHQSKAWEIAKTGKNYVVATGTGSGKTESFLIPIINHCLKNPANGIQAIIIYPLKALAKNQGDRFGELLDELNSRNNINLKYVIFDADLNKRAKQEKKDGSILFKKSELKTKEQAIETPPNILLTNYVMLERILTRPKYLKMIDSKKIKFFVLDEIHSYRGAQGIDVSLLIKRFNHQINNETIQYIGTSATLGGEDTQKAVTFLEKIFGKQFDKDSIILPEIDKSKNDEGQWIEKNKLEDLKIENSRLHAFFSAPEDIFRCLNCNKLHLTDKKCECGSKLLFKIMTCRHCGHEYFEYPYKFFSKKMDSIKSIGLGTQEGIEKSKYFRGSEETAFLVATKNIDFDEEYLKKVKICGECGSIKSEREYCPKGCNSESKEIYILDYSEKPLKLGDGEKTNNKFCPVCEAESNSGVIALVSKLSDENCSHIIFDEAFLNLPEENRKMLIFTDNVQRTSKFAREIQETHLKNYTKLKIKLELNDSKEIWVTDFVDSIKNKIKREIGTDDADIKQIQKEIYEEIFSNRRKVGSIYKSGLFDLEIDKLNDEKSKIILDSLMDSCQVYEYYSLIKDIYDKDDTSFRKNFLENKSIRNKYIRKICNVRAVFNDKKYSKEIEEFWNLEKNLEFDKYIINTDGCLFANATPIKVISSQNLNETNDNYYLTWGQDHNVPLIETYAHSAKISPERRGKIEEAFSSKEKNNLAIIATSTLEMGIDIGKLDFVGLLYAPPSPAQYIQRIGRAGRGNKKNAIALTYLAKNTLNSWYFKNPKELISGIIEPPPFNINLEQPIKKSIFGMLLFILLNDSEFRKIISDDYKYSSWLSKKNEIINYVKNKNLDKISKRLEDYSQTFEKKYDCKEIIEEWSEKLSKHIDLHNDLESHGFRDNSDKKDLFKFLQTASLLPDYAFGNSGVLVLIKDQKTNLRNKINGFQLNQTCPPLFVDFDKRRYKTTGINLDWKATEISESKKCNECKIIYSNNQNSCSSCGRELTASQTFSEVVYPKIIYARPSGFSNNPTSIEWEECLVNLPCLDFDNDFISKPTELEILNYFKKVRGEKKHYFCEKCGQVFYEGQKSKNPAGCKHVKAKWKIGEKLKTRGIILDLSKSKITASVLSPLTKTILNALISAITIESGCEDGEVSGFDINEDKIVIYDKIQGGVGFTEILYKTPEKIIKKAMELCDSKITNCCEDGCLKCIGSFWRQNDLEYLDKSNPLIRKFFEEILNQISRN